MTGPKLSIWSSMSMTGTKSLSPEMGGMVWLSSRKYQSPFMLGDHHPNLREPLDGSDNQRKQSPVLYKTFIISIFFHWRNTPCLSLNEPDEWLMDLYCMCWQSKIGGQNPNRAHDLNLKVKHRFVSRGTNVETLQGHLVSREKCNFSNSSDEMKKNKVKKERV